MLSNKDRAIKFGITDLPTIERFKAKLKPQENGCIEFDGTKWDKRDLYRGFTIYKTKKDHGQSVKGIMVKAHRFSYALANGFDALPIAGKFSGSSKIINHICHNKTCVNPNHLNILTSRENLLPENKKPND